MKTLSHDDYTVGWICALPLEMATAKAMLDEEHANLQQPSSDSNSYILGEISGHNIVVACLSSGIYGTTSAAIVGSQMLSSFPSIRFGLMVGIGGGVPGGAADVRLGDVVVSKPTANSSGVIQYDYGKTVQGGRFHHAGMLNKPPQVILRAVANLEAEHMMESSRIPIFLSHAAAKLPSMSCFTYCGQEHDCLFEADYDHIGTIDTCEGCDKNMMVTRESRASDHPKIYYGLIASGNQVMKHGRTRDQLAHKFGILCFEMEAAGLMDHFPCLVVRGICDYADSHKNKRWQGYAAAVAAAYTKDLLSVISSSPNKSTDHFRVQFDVTDVPVANNFIGRDEELGHLWDCLYPDSSKMRNVAIVHGMGGIGKTQLAIHFARTRRADYTAIFWLNGKDRGMLVRSLASIASRLPKGQIDPVQHILKSEEEDEKLAQQVLKWLAIDGNSRWLLIFDNIDQNSASHAADQGTYDIREFFPPADHGSIIITTRLQQLIELGSSHSLQKLEDEKAIQLLMHSSGYTRGTTNNDATLNSDITQISHRLDGLPLAIVIAGSFIRRTGMSFAKYLQHYEESWHSLQLAAGPQHEYSNGNILTTWTISYKEVMRNSEAAAKLLLLLSYFNNQDIWFELIQFGLRSINPPEWFIQGVSDEITFSNTIRHLIDFSLVQTHSIQGGYSMHPVIQDWCQNGFDDTNASNEKLKKELRLISLISVGYCLPTSHEENDWILQRRLLPHADHILKSIQPAWDIPQTREVLFSIDCLGLLYKDQSRLREAEEMYQHALTGREAVLGPDDMDTLSTMNNIGVLYWSQGRLKEAEDMYRKALTGREMVLGKDDKDTLFTVHNLGALHRSQGRLKEAEEMYQRALTGRERVLGPDHIDTLCTVNNLGTVYWTQGRLQEAEDIYQRALKGRERALGPDHTDTIATVHNLGALYWIQGRLKEAEEMFQRALTGHEKTLGPNHIDTLSTVNNLGAVYRNQGRLKEAEEMYQRALAGREKALGLANTRTLYTANNLAALYKDQGRLKEAEEIYQRVLTGHEKTLGRDNIDTLYAAKNLGVVYQNQGRLEKAEEIYQQAMTGLEKALGPDHTRTLETVHCLANLYRDQGKLKEAEIKYDQVIGAYEKNLGPGHSSTLQAIDDLGTLYLKSGNLDQAERMYMRASTGLETLFGSDHPRILQVTLHKGNLFERRGKLREASTLYKQALAGYQQKLGDSHPSTLEALFAYGVLLEQQGRQTKAEAIYQQVLKGREETLGLQHPDTLEVAGKLSTLTKKRKEQIDWNGILIVSAVLFLIILLLAGKLRDKGIL